MAPPRKTGQTSTRASPDEEDPERSNQTINRAPRPPAADEDPERANPTQAKSRNPLLDDPERNQKTNARSQAPQPPKRGKREDKEYRTASNYGGGEELADYSTGNNYQALEDDAMAGSLNLEGDGLDPVDPEMVPRTSALPAHDPDAAAEGEGEGEDEQNETQAGPPLKLEIVGGPDKGKKKKFKGVRMVIGRTPGVDLQLSDQSVSRRHVELVHSDKGVLLRDLASGNGTRVNGAKVSEKMLEHGDEIGIGKTRIRFIDELAAFKKAREDKEKAEAEEQAKAEAAKEEEAKAEAAKEAGAEPEAEKGPEAAESGESGGEEGGEEPAAESDEAPEKSEKSASRKGPPSTRSKAVRTSRHEEKQTPLDRFKALPPPVRIGIIGGAAALLLTVVLLIVFHKPDAPPADPNKVAAERKMQDARNFAREATAATELDPAQEKFEAAVKAAADAEELMPGIDKARLGNQARDAVSVIRALQEAKSLLEADRFEDTRKALDKITTTNPKLDDHKKRLELAWTAAFLKYRLDKIDEFIGSGDVDSAKALLAELPSEAQGPPAAKIAEYEKELEAQREQEKREAAIRNANLSASAKARREEAIALAFAVVDRKFAGGEWDRAASECSRVIDEHSGDAEIQGRAKQIASMIPNFGRNYDEGIKKFKLGQIASASRPLRAAWQLYNQIGLHANPYGQELSQKLAEASVAAGREALLREDLLGAAVNFRDATKLDPSDAKARAGMDEVVARADDLYQSAYIIKDRDSREALKKFKIVVEVTPSGSATHEKAKNQIAAMSP